MVRTWDAEKNILDIVECLLRLFRYEDMDIERNIANDKAVEAARRDELRSKTPTRFVHTTPSHPATVQPTTQAAASSKPQFRVKNKRDITPPVRESPWAQRPNYKRYKLIIDQARAQSNSLEVGLQENALEKIVEHAEQDKNNERFGILVGRTGQYRNTKAYWVQVIDMFPARSASASRAHVEVTPEELIRLDKEVEDRYPGADVRKIGWYHSHPGHHIFMSGTDAGNQELSYNASWQIALVVDPVHKEYGVFSGSPPVPVRNVEIIQGKTAIQPLVPPVPADSSHVVQPDDPARPDRRPDSRSSIPQRRRLLSYSLVAVLAAVVLIIAPKIIDIRVSWLLPTTEVPSTTSSSPSRVSSANTPGSSSVSPKDPTITPTASPSPPSGSNSKPVAGVPAVGGPPIQPDTPTSASTPTPLPIYPRTLTNTSTPIPTNTTPAGTPTPALPDTPTFTSTPVPTPTGTPIPILEASPTLIATYTPEFLYQKYTTEDGTVVQLIKYFVKSGDNLYSIGLRFHVTDLTGRSVNYKEFETYNSWLKEKLVCGVRGVNLDLCPPEQIIYNIQPSDAILIPPTSTPQP